MKTKQKRGPLPPFPLQPVYLDEGGTPRFRGNRIVEHLLDAFPGGLNELARTGPFDLAEWVLFAQLIGYSVSGFGDLSYASPEAVQAADAATEKLK